MAFLCELLEKTYSLIDFESILNSENCRFNSDFAETSCNDTMAEKESQSMYFHLLKNILNLQSTLLKDHSDGENLEKQGCAYCNELLTEWLSQPQLCSVVDREERIQKLISQLPETAEDMHRCSTDQHHHKGSLNPEGTRLQLLAGKKGRNFLTSLDHMEFPEFVLEMQSDLQTAKDCLLQLIFELTEVEDKAMGLPKTSSRGGTGPCQNFARRLMSIAGKTLPVLTTDPELHDAFSDDGEALKLLPETVLAKPTLETLPDLCAAVFNNQRCLMLRELRWEGYVTSILPQSPSVTGQHSRELYTAFVMSVFSAASEGLPLSSMRELLSAAVVLLVPVFTTWEKSQIFSRLRTLLEDRQRAAHEEKNHQMGKNPQVASSHEPQADLIAKNLVEEHFEPVAPVLDEVLLESDDIWAEEQPDSVTQETAEDEDNADTCVLQ